MIQESMEKIKQVETRSNPFPGLRPFELHESYLFFGRDGQSEQVISKLAHNRFLAVIGTSGSGKSSLVRAGLLPSLLTEGPDQTALRRADRVQDQFLRLQPAARCVEVGAELPLQPPGLETNHRDPEPRHTVPDRQQLRPQPSRHSRHLV